MSGATPSLAVVQITDAERDELSVPANRKLNPYAEFPEFLEAARAIRPPASATAALATFSGRTGPGAVSYTHLTLPTICSG